MLENVRQEVCVIHFPVWRLSKYKTSYIVISCLQEYCHAGLEDILDGELGST